MFDKGVGDKTQSFSFVTDPFNSDPFNSTSRSVTASISSKAACFAGAKFPKTLIIKVNINQERCCKIQKNNEYKKY